MRQTDRRKLDEIEAFRTDLMSFKRMLEARQNRRRRRYGMAYDVADDDPELAARIETMHESLLRRQGSIEPLCDRVLGRYLLEGGFSLWDLALHDSQYLSQAYVVDQLAGHVTTLIGRLEANPSLLRPPKPAPAATPSPSALPPLTVYANTVNIAQTARGNVSQHNVPQQDLAEVRRLLVELEAAIRAVQAPKEEIDGYVESIEELNAELGKPEPLISRLTRGLGAIQWIAGFEGTWQAWDRAQRIATDLAPKAHDLIQIMIRATGSG